MVALERLRHKIHTSGLPGLTVDGLNRLGLCVQAYYVYLERPDFALASRPESLPSGLEVRVFASARNALEQLPPSAVPVGAGKWSFAAVAAYSGSEPVAWVWAAMDVYKLWDRWIPLMPREAYLCHAYTVPALRGRGIAGALRPWLYELVRDLGRDLLWSITCAWNRPACRYKGKLGLRPSELWLYAGTTRRGRHFRLRRFATTDRAFCFKEILNRR